MRAGKSSAFPIDAFPVLLQTIVSTKLARMKTLSEDNILYQRTQPSPVKHKTIAYFQLKRKRESQLHVKLKKKVHA